MLTMNEIKGLKPKERQYEVYEDSREKGTGRLGVSVGTSGSKIFIFRFFWEGKRQFLQLGKFPEMSLSDARDLAKFYGGQLKSGKNPKVELERERLAKEQAERQEAENGSIKQLIHSYVWKMKVDGKRTYDDVLRRLEKDVYPVIPPATKAKDVTPLDVKQILTNMIQRGAIVQSNRVRSYLHAAFQYGLGADLDPANNRESVLFGLTMNPVSVIPRQGYAEKPGQNWLSLECVQKLMTIFEDAPNVGSLPAQLLRLCFYTGGQRPYELAASEWSSVNWEQRTLLVIDSVSKNKREHLIPLTESALVILKELHENNTDGSRYIFAQKDPEKHFRTDSFAQAIIYFRKSHPDFPVFVARDVRRTCKTLMGELGITKELRDRTQNHAQNDVSSRHYDRYNYLPEKRRALEAWEARLNGTDTEVNVIRFTSSRVSSS